MQDELIDPFAVIDTYVDDFVEQYVHNGNFRCTGYTVVGDRRIVAVRLVMPANIVLACQARARAALNGLMMGGGILDGRPKFLS